MTAVAIEPVSYSYETASAATGLSVDVIQRAVRAGDLEVRYPQVAGRTLSKPVIERDELARWISQGAPERRSP
ncbi:hypothetical protein [Phycicoccus jejuensis]|uniref:hypothetical protein n=1 Tax=Phycicoccus jejuensis TaxID=367299 RepID=UPI0004C3FA18|nr:hypothetical protein [Phycicoccus jejuensis]